MTVAGKSWKLKDKNVAELAQMQWYPFVYTNSPPIIPYEVYTNIDLKWRNGQVEATFVKQQIPLETAKGYRRDEVNSRREELLKAGIVFQGNTFDTDDRSIQNIMGVNTRIALGMVLPAGFTWRSANNLDVPMDNVKILALGASMAHWTDAIYNASWTHKRAIDALTTVDAVINYDTDTGWVSNVY
jgi:hypothetical protein